MAEVTQDTSTPTAIDEWVAALPDPARREQMASALSPQVVLEFAGRRQNGREAVLDHFGRSPRSSLATADRRIWNSGGNDWVVRFTGPGGSTLPSPGGPITALDFLLTLDDDDLIVGLGMRPHHTEPKDLADSLTVGASFPDFSLPDVVGEPTSWHEAGSAAYVVLWTCNVCPWALGWHDRLQDVIRDYAPQGVRSVQINGNDAAISPGDDPAKSAERVGRGDFASPYLLDDKQVVARQLGVRHTPEVFVLDEHGTVTYHGAPDKDSEEPALRAEWLRAALDAVLAGRAPALAETEPIGCTIKWTL